MRNIEILAEIALIFTNSEPFSQQINKTMEIIGRYLSLSRVYIFLDTIDGKMTNNVFEWCNENINQQINNLQNISYTDVPSWKLFLNRGAIIVDAISDLPIDLHEILKSQDIISLVVYPLIIKGEIKGFVGFDECLKPRKWQHSEVYIAKTFAGLVSGSYERSLIYEQLNIKKNNFKTFFNAIDDFFFIVSYDGSIIHVNNAVINKLGYSNEEIKRFKLIDLHSLDKRAEAIEILRLMIEGKLKYCNLEIESKYGEKFIVESRIWFGTWNEQECIFGISKDMTKEQEALQKFTKIFNINPIPMSINNLDGEFIQINKALTEILGYEEKDILGKKPRELEMIVDTDKYDKAVERLLRGEKMLNVGIDIIAKDGSIKNAILSSEIIDNQGIKNILTVMIDETENNLLHYSLEAERIRLENIIQGTGVGTWEWNINTGETKFNEAWAYMLGYTLEELAPINIDTWIKLTHPEDLAKSDVLLKKHFSGELDFYKCEIRLKHKNGEWVWVLDSGSVIEWDKDDQPLKMFGTHVDINAIKIAEERPTIKSQHKN